MLETPGRRRGLEPRSRMRPPQGVSVGGRERPKCESPVPRTVRAQGAGDGAARGTQRELSERPEGNPVRMRGLGHGGGGAS